MSTNGVLMKRDAAIWCVLMKYGKYRLIECISVAYYLCSFLLLVHPGLYKVHHVIHEVAEYYSDYFETFLVSLCYIPVKNLETSIHCYCKLFIIIEFYMELVNHEHHLYSVVTKLPVGI